MLDGMWNFIILAYAVLVVFSAVGWILYHRGNNKLIDLTMKFMQAQNDTTLVLQKLDNAMRAQTEFFARELTRGREQKDGGAR